MIAPLLADDVEPVRLHGFLIQWSSLSVQRQEPTEQLLALASRRCADLGDPSLAMILLRLAGDAIDGYRRLADDRQVLVELWNRRGGPPLELTSLITQPVAEVVQRCVEHDRALALGPRPWTALAAVYEVDALIAAIAPRLCALAIAKLGDEVGPGLASLRALACQGDSRLARATTQMLATHPERREPMLEAGTAALARYQQLLHACVVGSRALLAWQARQRP